MPILAALLGAIFTGVFYWVIYGNGKEVLDYYLDKKAEKKRLERDSQTAALARDSERLAPLRSLNDPRDAAMALMIAMAQVRGEVTAEQKSIINSEALRVLDVSDPSGHRYSIAEHACRRAQSSDLTAKTLLPVLDQALNQNERADLLAMLHAVANLHDGPTDEQGALLARIAQGLGLEGHEAPGTVG